ncbi:MAG: phytochelatin synthase family protein [Myxococcota bacterium]
MSPATVHRKPLPDGLIAFESDEGRQLLVDAVTAGTGASFFPLIAQFHTQAEPAWCGLGSLVTALNALGVDPGRAWKGPWRHFDESLLICCSALEQAANEGLSLVQVGCLARCNGAEVRGVSAEPGSLAAFREDLLAASRAPRGPFVVVNYARPALGQTGAGHFSPIGAVHEGRDLALVLDVARFKYPPHWVPIEALWRAMIDVDPSTGHPRGWLVLDRPAESAPRPERCDPAYRYDLPPPSPTDAIGSSRNPTIHASAVAAINPADDSHSTHDGK